MIRKSFTPGSSPVGNCSFLAPRLVGDVRAWLSEASGPGGVLGDAEAETTAFLARHGLEVDGRVVLPLLALVTIVLVVAVVRLARRRQAAAPRAATPQPLARVVRTPAIVGYTALLVFFGGFGTFAAVAHLASAAVSPGVVSPDGSRKTIAHLEGGIVRADRRARGRRGRAGPDAGEPRGRQAPGRSSRRCARASSTS
jgi:hypothetical protein